MEKIDNNPKSKWFWIYWALLVITIAVCLFVGEGTVTQNAIGIVLSILLAAVTALLLGIFSGATYWKRLKWTYLIVLLFMGFIAWINEGYKSGGTGGKNCTYCGNSYSNNGYYHLEYDCVEYKTDPGFNAHCSVKCCSDDWTKNGSGRYH